MLSGRYERQILLPEVGEAGQKRLLSSSALVVGCGGLGSTLLYCLCGMGVGRIGFCDGDTVSLSNLNRQFLHTVSDIGRNKAQSAYEKLTAFAPELRLEPLELRLTDENAREVVASYDLVLLAVDSIPSRLIVNRACVSAGVPMVEAGIHGLNGSLLSIRPGKTACLACLYGDALVQQSPIPSFAPIVSAIASLEAQCAANILLELPNQTDGRMLLFDGSAMTTEFVPVSKNKNCPVCGQQ
jgi:molybdopterin/thiamine biosynthesis adenylyltransferase